MNLSVVMVNCLLITIFIELALALILRVRDKKDILNVILVNIATNPVVVAVPVYVNIEYNLMYRNIVLAILEVLTVLLEGRIYQKYLNYKKINPYLLSLILNAGSFFLGEVINKIIY